MKRKEFEKEYFTNLIKSYVKWEADEIDIQSFLDDVEYMQFDILYACDSSVILDAGKFKMYIEWGINECPVYVDVNMEYTRIGRIRNSRFWALVERSRKR